MTGRSLAAVVAVAAVLVVSRESRATSVSYDVMHIAGNTWEYTYTVINDTLAVDIEEFSVFFDLNLYENLVATATPADWDPLVLQPDPGLPDDGLYDALALVAGIAPGSSLDGFSVQFDFLGTGTPGAQPVEIIDPLTFASIDPNIGPTVPVQGPAIPEPTTFVLLGFGLCALLGMGRYIRDVGERFAASGSSRSE